MEEWRPINDYPNYFISSLGRVKTNNEYIIKQGIDRYGYFKVILSNNGVKKTFKVHRLVGIHFLPNWNNFKILDHLDRVRTNNNVFNLKWSSVSDSNLNRNCRKDYIYFDKNRNKWLVYSPLNKKLIGGRFNSEKLAKQFLEHHLISQDIN
jgi:hypothetical protein